MSNTKLLSKTKVKPILIISSALAIIFYSLYYITNISYFEYISYLIEDIFEGSALGMKITHVFFLISSDLLYFLPFAALLAASFFYNKKGVAKILMAIIFLANAFYRIYTLIMPLIMYKEPISFNLVLKILFCLITCALLVLGAVNAFLGFKTKILHIVSVVLPILSLLFNFLEYWFNIISNIFEGRFNFSSNITYMFSYIFNFTSNILFFATIIVFGLAFSAKKEKQAQL